MKVRLGQELVFLLEVMFRNSAGVIRVGFRNAAFGSDADATSFPRNQFEGSHFLSPRQGPEEAHLTAEPCDAQNVSLEKGVVKRFL
jgi:hypothetical protein